MKNSKNIWESLLKFSLVLILVLSFLQVKMKFGWDPLDRCSLPPDSILIESITLSDSVMNIKANKTQNLLTQIEPANATNQNLRWSSSDTTVAIVHPTTGSVTTTGKGGECIITAVATDDSGKSANIKIKVNKETNDSVVLVDTIIFPKSNGEITLNPGLEFEIDATVWPENATNKTLKWKSDNEIVAIVDNGVVTGKEVGNCTITASSTDGSGVLKSIKVHVQKIVKKVTSIDFDKSTLTINIGDKKQIVAKVLPSDATNKTLAWKSSNEGIATVSNGVVTGKSEGNCTITASSTDGSNVVKSIKVHVQKIVKKVTSIDFDKSTLTINIGDKKQIVAKVLPSDATNKTLAWKSSNEGIATVSNGVVTGKSEGNCTITASSTDGSNVVKSIKVRVQVTPPPGDPLDGKTIEEKVKYYLSYFSNSTNTTTSKKAKAKDMDSLFAPDALIIIKDGPVSQKEKKSRIGIWASSKMKIRYISHKVNTSGLIKELTVEEDL